MQVVDRTVRTLRCLQAASISLNKQKRFLNNMVTAIKGPVQSLVNAGLMDVLLPFVLIFGVTYGILERTNVLGVGKRKENTITAVAIAGLSVFAVSVLNIVNLLVAFMSLVLITGVLIALMFGVVSARDAKPNKMIMGILLFIFFVTLLFVFVEAGLINKSYFFGRVLFPLIVLIAVISTIVYFVQKYRKAQAA